MKNKQRVYIKGSHLGGAWTYSIETYNPVNHTVFSGFICRKNAINWAIGRGYEVYATIRRAISENEVQAIFNKKT